MCASALKEKVRQIAEPFALVAMVTMAMVTMAMVTVAMETVAMETVKDQQTLIAHAS